jgi:hypothetical protein
VVFAYGIFGNTAPADFGRLLGIYVVLFFIAPQVVNLVVFKRAPGRAASRRRSADRRQRDRHAIWKP